MMLCYKTHDNVMLYNRYVMLYNTRYVMLCHLTHVKLCYITHDMLYNT